MNNLINLYDNKHTINSRIITNILRRRHNHLCRDIRKYISFFEKKNINSELFFQKDYYRSGTGKKYTCYLVTKLGFEFLIYKSIGKKGAILTANYMIKNLTNKLNML